MPIPKRTLITPLKSIWMATSVPEVSTLFQEQIKRAFWTTSISTHLSIYVQPDVKIIFLLSSNIVNWKKIWKNLFRIKFLALYSGRQILSLYVHFLWVLLNFSWKIYISYEIIWKKKTEDSKFAFAKSIQSEVHLKFVCKD